MGILQRVHLKNIVHGDVKPNNLALTVSTPGIGMIYLIDFGLAQEIRKPVEHGGTRKRKVFEGNPYFASVNALRGYGVFLFCSHSILVYVACRSIPSR